MTYPEFEKLILNSMREVLYNDTEGRDILVIRMMDLFAIINEAERLGEEKNNG